MHDPTSETAEQVKLKLVTRAWPYGQEKTNKAQALPKRKTSTSAPPKQGSRWQSVPPPLRSRMGRECLVELQPVELKAVPEEVREEVPEVLHADSPNHETGTSSRSTAEASTQSGAAAGAESGCASAPATEKTSGCLRHPAALLKILADPGASEEDWLAACYEMENHPNYKPFDSKSSARASEVKRLMQACIVIGLIGMSGAMLAHNFTNHQPAPVRPQQPLPPAPLAPAADIDFGPYMGNVQREIKRHWYPPKGGTTLRNKVAFKVAKNGEVSSVRIIKPTASDAFDRAALTAVINASPTFGPLPEGSPKDVDIEFTFDYNTYNRRESN